MISFKGTGLRNEPDQVVVFIGRSKIIGLWYLLINLFATRPIKLASWGFAYPTATLWLKSSVGSTSSMICLASSAWCLCAALHILIASLISPWPDIASNSLRLSPISSWRQIALISGIMAQLYPVGFTPYLSAKGNMALIISFSTWCIPTSA